MDDESADQRRFLDKAQVRFARPHFLLGALPLAIVINQASDSDGASALVEIRPAECPQPFFPSVNAMNLKLHGRRFLGAAEKPETLMHVCEAVGIAQSSPVDRTSTRLNPSH